MLMHFRYQIILGVLVGVISPAVLRQILFDVPFSTSAQLTTVMGGAVAVVLGYVGYRRLLLFPGIASGGYVVTSLTITFGLLVVVLLLCRIDYSRAQLFSSYILSIATLLFVHLHFERTRELAFAYVPGGGADTLPEVPYVRWYRIANPAEEPGSISSIVVDLHHEHSEAWESAITRWVLAGIPVFDARPAREQLTGRVEINHISENTLGSLNPNAIWLKVKLVTDFVVAVAAIVLTAPIFVLIAVAIRLDSPGPAIFRQRRTGFRARPFTVYKFRTMHVAVTERDEEQIRLHAMTRNADTRITRFGRLLRRSRLDELPQLFNVVKGEMSLIGPRPEALSLSRWYESEIPFYHYRHIIKPGLTGWAQVNQGHVTALDDVREKLNLDFYYVKNYSVWLDLLITLRTISIIVTGHGAR